MNFFSVKLTQSLILQIGIFNMCNTFKHKNLEDSINQSPFHTSIQNSSMTSNGKGKCSSSLHPPKLQYKLPKMLINYIKIFNRLNKHDLRLFL